MPPSDDDGSPKRVDFTKIVQVVHDLVVAGVANDIDEIVRLILSVPKEDRAQLASLTVQMYVSQMRHHKVADEAIASGAGDWLEVAVRQEVERGFKELDDS